MIQELQDILDIIWGTEEPKKKRKPPRDSKGRFVSKKEMERRMVKVYRRLIISIGLFVVALVIIERVW